MTHPSINNHEVVARLLSNADAAEQLAQEICGFVTPLMDYTRTAYKYTVPEFTQLVFPNENEKYYYSKRFYMATETIATSFTAEQFVVFLSLFGFSLQDLVHLIREPDKPHLEFSCPYDAKVMKIYSDASGITKRQLLRDISEDDRVSETARNCAKELLQQEFLQPTYDPTIAKKIIWSRRNRAFELGNEVKQLYSTIRYLKNYYGIPRIALKDILRRRTNDVLNDYYTRSSETSTKIFIKNPTIELFLMVCFQFGFDIPTQSNKNVFPLRSIFLPYYVFTGLPLDVVLDLLANAVEHEPDFTHRRVIRNATKWFLKNGKNSSQASPNASKTSSRISDISSSGGDSEFDEEELDGEEE